MICSESCGTLACCSNCSWHPSSSRTAGVLKVTEHRSVKTWPVCESVVITRTQVTLRSQCRYGCLGVWVPLVTTVCLWLCQCRKNKKSKQSESVSMSMRLLIDLQNEFQRCDDVICTGRERKNNCSLKV